MPNSACLLETSRPDVRDPAKKDRPAPREQGNRTPSTFDLIQGLVHLPGRKKPSLAFLKGLLDPPGDIPGFVWCCDLRRSIQRLLVPEAQAKARSRRGSPLPSTPPGGPRAEKTNRTRRPKWLVLSLSCLKRAGDTKGLSFFWPPFFVPSQEKGALKKKRETHPDGECPLLVDTLLGECHRPPLSLEVAQL